MYYLMKIMQVYTCGMLCLRSTVQDDYCSCMYHCYLQVDFEESKVVGRFVVKPNVDAELDDSEWQSFVLIKSLESNSIMVKDVQHFILFHFEEYFTTQARS